MEALLTSLEKILPAYMYHKLIGAWDRNGFHKYLKNTGWTALARLTTLVISFLTIAIVARYLGPDNYGKLSYAQSFVALFSAFASLGIDQILYRDLIAEPDKEYELLGTAFLTKICFGFFTLIATIVTAFMVNDDLILTWMIGMISITFILQPFGVVSHFFNAQVKAKYMAYVSIAVAFMVPAIKLLVVFFDKGILYFSAIIAIEASAYAIGYIYIYVRVFKHDPWLWKFSYTRFTSLLHDSWPLLLATFSGYIYGRIDQVMIQHYIDYKAVGLYDIAVRLTELLGFLPGVIIASLYPAIINARIKDKNIYSSRLKSITFLCMGIATISALALYVLSPFFIKIIFGAKYIEAVPLLKIYVWSTIGTVGIILMQQYLISEHHSRWFLFFSILGASINVILNMFFIPYYGMHGAAYATLLTLLFILTIFLMLKNYLSNKHTV